MNSPRHSEDHWRWIGGASPPDLPRLLNREWLETNGLGGFASSTVSGANTRRYHAVLVAAMRPPAGRVALVSNLHEALIRDGSRADLSTNLYNGGFVHPSGYLFLESFDPLPAPTWRFRTPLGTIEKTLAMIQGRNLTVVRYVLAPGSATTELEVRILLSGRDYHSVMRARDSLNPSGHSLPRMVYLPLPHGLPSVWVGHHAHTFHAEHMWYYNFDYPCERERGLEDREDLLSAGVFMFRLQPGRPAWMAIGTDPVSADDAADLFQHELELRAEVPLANDSDPLVRELARATAAFIVRRGDGLRSVIAGYPWFTDWGRDTFISLPGLTLVTGRFDVARQIVQEFGRHVNEGLIPNRFPDTGDSAEYNSMDAALWYIAAVYQYVCYTDDLELLQGGLMDVLASIIEWHERGTRYGIHEDVDGLLCGGADGVQLTWMDAKVGDWVVTPRRGKPVEISALWYNALAALARLSRRIGQTRQAERLEKKSACTRAAFNAQFWNGGRGCLYDVLGPAGPDPKVRPNQLISMSLPFPVLDDSKRQAVLDTVERRLLTPLGLRSLDPSDPDYVGRFEGGPLQRDRAYHQGTAWPWLLGPFITASVQSRADRSAARSSMHELLERLGEHLGEAGLGSICEVADGDPPHRPGGCYFQAWSVAEPLRALCEDVLDRRPS